ncbi:MAG: hypothetical protein KDC95_16870 [Planctomycetes bacterium]|nr:hypothetical protein [Planctomycetota bacterium]
MSGLVRLLLGLVLLGGIAGMVFWFGGAKESGVGASGTQSSTTSQNSSGPLASSAERVWESSTQCKECHEDVWSEWHGSHHQIAYLNPSVRKLSEDFRNKECQACHLPVPISMTGYAMRTLPRQTYPEEGISCLSCHLGKSGEVLARATVDSAPCKPVASEDFVSMRLCESCHNQHKTTDQWRASPQFQAGTSCNDCHMPEVERKGVDGSTHPGRGHRYLGAHDKPTLLKAGKFDVTKIGDEIELRLENIGAGHNFPTEERHRAVDMMVRFVNGDGTPSDWTRGYRFRQPYRDEPGENTQLPAGQAKAVRVGIPKDAVKAEARLWYRLTPFVGDDSPESTLLEERSVDLR